MPRSMEMKRIRDLTQAETLRDLAADERLRALIGERGGLRELIGTLLGDVPDAEREWFEAIPSVQQEAIRAVINEVVSGDGDLELEVHFTPAYDYAVAVYDFDRTVVINVSGPYTGTPTARQSFVGSR